MLPPRRNPMLQSRQSFGFGNPRVLTQSGPTPAIEPHENRFDPLSNYGVNSTNIRIVSTFRPSSRIAFWPSSDRSNSWNFAISGISAMTKFQELLRSDEGQKAMREDGLKVETMRMLVEFTP